MFEAAFGFLHAEELGESCAAGETKTYLRIPVFSARLEIMGIGTGSGLALNSTDVKNKEESKQK